MDSLKTQDPLGALKTREWKPPECTRSDTVTSKTTDGAIRMERSKNDITIFTSSEQQRFDNK